MLQNGKMCEKRKREREKKEPVGSLLRPPGKDAVRRLSVLDDHRLQMPSQIVKTANP
jgi:hypothetical protein